MAMRAGQGAAAAAIKQNYHHVIRSSSTEAAHALPCVPM
jgi:hypothetical protein